MAQLNYTPIQLYYSTTPSAVPSAASLTDGELAINTADGKLYYKTSGGTVAVISSAVNVISFSGGSTGLTPAAATSGAITLAGTLNVGNGGTAITSYTTGDILYASGAGVLSKLPIGTAGQVLQVSGGLPTWGASSSGVTTFSAGTTGLTPSTGTSGAVTLAGTLNAVNGGTGIATYATGDVLYASATNTLAKLPAGTNTYVLTMVGGLPAWSAPSGGVASFQTSMSGLSPNVATTGAVTLSGILGSTSGGTGFSTYAAGDMIYASATNTLSKLGAGTNGQFLTVSGGVPTWTTVSAGGVASFSAGSTGLTPATASTGAVTLGGTLAATSGGTGLSTYATGDIIYASATNTLSKLPAGTNGYVLTLVGGSPAWQASTGGVTSFQTSLAGLTPSTSTTGAVTLAGTLDTTSGGTNITSYAPGDILYASATNVLSKLGIGTNGQVLTVVSGSVAWAAGGGSGVASISFGSSGLTPNTPTTGSVVVGGALNTGYGGTGVSTYAAGDTLYYNSGTSLTKLALGAANALYVVNSGGTAPTWSSLSTMLDTISSTQGTVLYRSAGSWVGLAPGTAGQYLQTQGAGANPQWNTVSVAGGVTSITFGSTGLTPSTASTGAVSVGGTLVATNGGTGINSLTVGDTLYASSTTAYSKLAIGTAGQVMTSTGTAPQWVSNLTTAAGGTGVSSYTAGDMLYYVSGTALSKLGIGAANTVMLSSGTAPSWTTVSAVLDTIGNTQGQILYRGATTWAVLAPGTAGNVLSTGGAAANPSWITPVTGLNGVTSTLNTAAPNNTNNVSSLTASGGTANQFIAIVPKGTGGIIAATPDSTATGGNVRGTNSVDLQTIRSAAAQVASTTGSVIAGGANNLIDSNNYGVISGGVSNQVSALYSVIAGGANNTITNLGSATVISGGTNNSATGGGSAIVGGIYRTDRSVIGSTVLAGSNGGLTTAGFYQTQIFTLLQATSSATATTMTADGGAASQFNQVVLPNNGAYGFDALIVAGTTAAGDAKFWRITGLVKRGANAAATSIVGSPTTDVLGGNAGASAWTVTVAADTTNGALNFTVTGQAAVNIRWQAKVTTVQVSF